MTPGVVSDDNKRVIGRSKQPAERRSAIVKCPADFIVSFRARFLKHEMQLYDCSH